MPCEINGRPGAVVSIPDGWSALSVETDGELVTGVHIVANPAKLERLVASLGPEAQQRPGVWEGMRPFRHRKGQPVR